jgi:hypothetical protein
MGQLTVASVFDGGRTESNYKGGATSRVREPLAYRQRIFTAGIPDGVNTRMATLHRGALGGDPARCPRIKFASPVALRGGRGSANALRPRNCTPTKGGRHIPPIAIINIASSEHLCFPDVAGKSRRTAEGREPQNGTETLPHAYASRTGLLWGELVNPFLIRCSRSAPASALPRCSGGWSRGIRHRGGLAARTAGTKCVLDVSRSLDFGCNGEVTGAGVRCCDSEAAVTQVPAGLGPARTAVLTRQRGPNAKQGRAATALSNG